MCISFSLSLSIYIYIYVLLPFPILYIILIWYMYYYVRISSPIWILLDIMFESPHQFELPRIKQFESIHQFALRQRALLASAAADFICERCSAIRIDDLTQINWFESVRIHDLVRIYRWPPRVTPNSGKYEESQNPKFWKIQ